MAKQTINTGSFDNDPSAESIRSAFTKVNSMMTDLYSVGHNVLAYGAIGNSNHSTGGGNDDTTAIQAAYDAANAAGGSAFVIFPARRTYRITDTIDVPPGVMTIGAGGQAVSGGLEPPTIVWDGADLGTMFLVHNTTGSTTQTSFTNLLFRGGGSIVNQPAAGIKFTSSVTNKIDSGTYIENCWFQWITGHGIHFANHGATNFYILGGRFDSCSEYGIYIDLSGDGRNFYGTIISPTWVGGRDPQGKGFLFCDGEAADSFGSSSIQIYGLHTEQNQSITESFASGANPYDKRGVIRLGVDSTVFGIQHRICVTGFEHTATGIDESHCAFQITATSGTDAAAAECVSIIVNNASGLQNGNTDAASTGEIRMFGGKVPAVNRYPFRGYRHGTVIWGKGKVTGSDFEQVKTFVDTYFRIRGLEVHPEAGTLAPALIAGTGSPEGVITAPMGSLFLRTDGSTSTTLYVKTSGAGNTGWTAK